MPTPKTFAPGASLNQRELRLIERARRGMAIHDGSDAEWSAGSRLVASGVFAIRYFATTHRATGQALCWVLTPTARRIFA